MQMRTMNGRDWKAKRALQLQELANLKADLDRGLSDLAAGRTKEFDPAKIIQDCPKVGDHQAKRACDRSQAFDLVGAGEKSRTPDLRITNALLYQLSYAGSRRTRTAACNEARSLPEPPQTI